MREKFLLWIAAAIAFGGCLPGAFVFDDFALLNDPAIASPSGLWECWRLAQTRPLTWSTFWASYQLGGENPVGYHLVSLALHLAVVALLWDVLRRLIGDRAALAGAAIFAVHPMVTEPVAYVFARGTLLATLFSLLAIGSWIAERRWIAVGWFAIAMLAKEECAAIPVFLLLLDLSRGRRPFWRPISAMFAIALALGLRVIWAISVTPGAPAGARAGITPAAYLAAQGFVVLRYLGMAVIPWGFSVDYPSVPPAPALAAASWVAIAVLAGMACLRFRRLGPGFWFLAGLALLAPSSSIFPAADLAADRRMYLPMIALSACVGLLLSKAPRAWVAGIVAVLGGVSIYYTGLWRSPELLWSQAERRAPEKLRPRLQLARAVPPERALEILAAARELAPEDPIVPSEQGRALLALSRPAEALAAFGRALALQPNDPGALNNRGAALLALGQSDAARADFERALGRDPCLFDARLNLRRMGAHSGAPDRECRYTPKQRAQLER